MVGARLKGGYEQNSGNPGILEGSKELWRDSGIIIARSVAAPKAGQTPVREANFSDKVFRLRSDIPVAEYHPVSGVNGSATPIDIGHSPSASNHPHCSIIDRTVGKDEQESKERKNGRTKVIQQTLDGLSEELKRQFFLLKDE